MVRKGFWFADGGMEFPLAWVFMLIAQALLGMGHSRCAFRHCRGRKRVLRQRSARVKPAARI
jgi:hypothetical protein